VREEFVKDKAFIGPLGKQLRPSFQVAQDVYKCYMLLIHPGDETYPKPIWVALALFNPMLTSNRSKCNIYFTPTLKTRNVQVSYVG
jgi:hypothetical protein